jgi:hypothetical protein
MAGQYRPCGCGYSAMDNRAIAQGGAEAAPAYPDAFGFSVNNEHQHHGGHVNLK